MFLLSPGRNLAQVSTASLNGVVKDPQGLVISNATVVLRNVDTSVEDTNTSNSAGAYAFLNVTPGRYTLEAKATGFSSAQVPVFALTVGQAAKIDLSLKVGAQTSIVTVEGATPQLETSSANLGTVVSVHQVTDLPLNGRNFTQLLLLTPGVSPVNVSQNSGTAYGAPIALGSSFSFPAMNGQTNRSNYFLADGLSNFLSYQSSYAVPPILDAIQEFKVVSHTDSAEFGSVLGGVVNVATKAGTNDLHGSAWEYARNAIFNARTYFLPKSATTPSFSENQFGGSLGGPVWIPKLYHGRSKTFFFGAYQGLRFTQVSSNLLRVPTAAQLSGDESGWPTQIYNPFSTRPDPASPGKFIRDPFPGNQIPATLIDPLTVAWAEAIYPAAGPIVDSAGDNGLDTTPLTQTQNEWTARVDQKVGANDSVWFRYSTNYTTQNGPNGLPGANNVTTTHPSNWGASYVHVFSPSMVLQVQFARTAGEEDVASFASPKQEAVKSLVGFVPSFIGDLLVENGGSLLPSASITGYSGVGEGITNFPELTSTYEYFGTLNKTFGNHSLKVGGGFTTMGQTLVTGNSSLTFTASQTGNPESTSAPGEPLASFLLGVPGGANRVNREEAEGGFRGVLSAFAQDSWRASTNLTFNYGLRYDVSYIPRNGTDSLIGVSGGPETGDIDFNNGTYILQQVPPACSVRGFAPCIPGSGALPTNVVVSPNGKIAQNTYTNLGPRVGFAYQWSNRNVLRGAFGIVYDNWAGVAQTTQNLAGAWPSTGQLQANNLNVPTSASSTPTATIQDPFAGLGTGLYPAPTPFGQVSYFFDPKKKNPYSDQWNFGIEHMLSQSTSVTADYVGSASKRLDLGGYYNTALTPGPGTPQARAPYPYIAATNYDRGIGAGNYNALQISLDRRFVNGFAYQIAYTWSKAIDFGGDGWFGVEGGTGGEVPQDPYNPSSNGDRSVTSFDIPQVFTANVLYQVPVGRGTGFSTGSRFADYVLGNWQLNGIVSARSGQPFTPCISSDIANTGNNPSRCYEHAELIGDPNLSKRTATEWFNTAAYATPPAYTFGTASRNSLRTARYLDLDTSLFRQFPIGGERDIELRAEAFNVLNNVVFGIPAHDLNQGTQFGTVTSTANSSRQLQLAAKFIF
jgi:hypothetical protein